MYFTLCPNFNVSVPYPMFPVLALKLSLLTLECGICLSMLLVQCSNNLFIVRFHPALYPFFGIWTLPLKREDALEKYKKCNFFSIWCNKCRIYQLPASIEVYERKNQRRRLNPVFSTKWPGEWSGGFFSGFKRALRGKFDQARFYLKDPTSSYFQK